MATTGISPLRAESPRGYHVPVCPRSWHYLAPISGLKAGPVARWLPEGFSFVGYRTQSGRSIVMEGRCSHVGANLAKGSVVAECLRCPLHGWEYDSNGVCVRIPASSEIPRWARQTTYPVQEIAGHVFFFNSPEAAFPFPGFEGVEWEDLRAARPFELFVEASWHVASSNGFDLQHFRFSHDRELIGAPVVDVPHPMSRRIVARFKVSGSSWRDRLTRRFAGPEVTMSVTDWAGNLIFVTARFARATSYGLFAAQPLEAGKTLARIIVFVPRSRTSLGRRLVDPADAWIRRGFIRKFLQSDVERVAGLRYHPRRLIGADQLLREYLEWLEQIHR